MNVCMPPRKALLNLVDFLKKRMNKIRIFYHVEEKLFHTAHIPGRFENGTAELGQYGELRILVNLAEMFFQAFYSKGIVRVRPGIILQIINCGIFQRVVGHFKIVAVNG